MFRRQAFVPDEVLRDGKITTLCFLDKLRLGSEEYAKELGERLKERIFVRAFPHLAQLFIGYIRSQEGPHVMLDQQRLDQISVER
jgi:hypothetical protein